MDRPNEVVISYLAYLKAQCERDASVCDLAELRATLPVLTSSAFVRPVDTSVDFSRFYGNKWDLPTNLSGADWLLAHPVYMQGQSDVNSWRDFLRRLGVCNLLILIKGESFFLTAMPGDAAGSLMVSSDTIFVLDTDNKLSLQHSPTARATRAPWPRRRHSSSSPPPSLQRRHLGRGGRAVIIAYRSPSTAGCESSESRRQSLPQLTLAAPIWRTGCALSCTRCSPPPNSKRRRLLLCLLDGEWDKG
ncbi:unnamed protein product [Lampetra fluviatilis]